MGKIIGRFVLGVCFVVAVYAVGTRTYDLETAHLVIKWLEAGMCITIFLSGMCIYIRDGFYKLKVKQFMNDKIKGGYITQDYRKFMKEFDEVQ